MTFPLKLYAHPVTGEHFTTGTAQGEKDAINSGYNFVRNEGYIVPPIESLTTEPIVPLKLYFGPAAKDNFTTGTAQGETDAIKSGYQFIRVEGYAFPDQQLNTVPLKLYFSDSRKDNMTIAASESEQEALQSGYRLIRVEGYVFPSYPPGYPMFAHGQDRGDLGSGNHIESKVTFSDSGRVDVETHIWTNNEWHGFTGGTAIFFLDDKGNVLANTPLYSYGVDGTWVIGKDSSRVLNDHAQLSPDIYNKTVIIDIRHVHDPKDRLKQDLATGVEIGKDIGTVVGAFA